MKKFKISFIKPYNLKFTDCVTSSHFLEFEKVCEDLYSHYLKSQNVCSVVLFRDLNYSGLCTRSHNHYLVVLRFTDCNKQSPVYFVIHHRFNFSIYSCKNSSHAGRLFNALSEVNYFIDESSDSPETWVSIDEDDDELPF